MSSELGFTLKYVFHGSLISRIFLLEFRILKTTSNNLDNEKVRMLELQNASKKSVGFKNKGE